MFGQLLARLVFLRKPLDRRRGRSDRRHLYPWECLTCHRADTMRRVGSADFGVQIVKCTRCGHMDRRLPTPRREEPWERIPDVVLGVAWGRLATLFLAALAGAVVVIRTW